MENYTSKPAVTFYDVIVYFIKMCCVVLLAIGVYMIGVQFKTIKVEQTEAVYPEVYRMNNDEGCQLIFRLLGIESVSYYDWEETANSLDVPVDSLTTDMYLKHLLDVDQ